MLETAQLPAKGEVRPDELALALHEAKRSLVGPPLVRHQKADDGTAAPGVTARTEDEHFAHGHAL